MNTQLEIEHKIRLRESISEFDAKLSLGRISDAQRMLLPTWTVQEGSFSSSSLSEYVGLIDPLCQLTHLRTHHLMTGGPERCEVRSLAMRVRTNQHLGTDLQASNIQWVGWRKDIWQYTDGWLLSSSELGPWRGSAIQKFTQAPEASR